MPTLTHTKESPSGARLRAWLAAGDCAVIVAVWAPLLVASSFRAPMVALVSLSLAVLTLAAVAAQRLYLSRVCAVPGAERTRLLRVGLVTGTTAVIVLPRVGVPLTPARTVVGALSTTALLALWRALFAAWLRTSRARGRFQRPLILVGTNDEAHELLDLLRVHPELGYRVCGAVGPRLAHEVSGLALPWLGELSDAPVVARYLHAGVLIAVTGIEVCPLSRLVRDLSRHRIAIHASSGLRRIDQKRIRALPLAHEPMFYIEPCTNSWWQDAWKRAFDVVGGGVALVLVSPVLLLGALAVRLEGNGPVLFRQQRLGKDGRPFEILKLRTMVVGAEEMQPRLALLNERRDGPLFKLRRDPRVTRTGRFLRATSIDELPQLLNVLRGEMSVVGPRPVLPEEAEVFDEELQQRFTVRPGITGLWQIEARDNPEFAAYRRLDLFYVENRSPAMDMAILVGTAIALLGELVRAVRRASPDHLSWEATRVALEPAGMAATEADLYVGVSAP